MRDKSGLISVDWQAQARRVSSRLATLASDFAYVFWQRRDFNGPLKSLLPLCNSDHSVRCIDSYAAPDKPRDADAEFRVLGFFFVTEKDIAVVDNAV